MGEYQSSLSLSIGTKQKGFVFWKFPADSLCLQHQKAPLCICLVRKEVTQWHFIFGADDEGSQENASVINEELLSPQAELGKYLRKDS